jgi:eukaryotic-like serine/threonine-protein kinase
VRRFRTGCAAAVTLALIAGCGSTHHAPKRPPVTTPTTTTTAASVTTPGVAGQSIKSAQATVAAAGLAADVFHRHSSTVPSGTAIGTKPAAGATASKGEVIVLYVSSGPAPVKTPNVVGASRTSAIKKLTKAGLTVVVNQQQTGGTGKVTAQTPAAGRAVSRGATVMLTVTTAAPTVSVPLVTAQSEEQAVTTLSKLGFAIAFTTQTVSDQGKDRIVLSQSPVAGTSVVKASTVTLIVGVYTKKT